MRSNQLLSVLSLFLLVPASITRAQTVTLSGTVSIEQDYRAVNFNSPKGNVKVILPGNLSGPGQGTVLLSGTVMAEPVGKTEKERTSNLKALQKMLLTIGGKSISLLPAQNHFDFSMPANLTTPVPIDLVDPKGDRATVMLKNPVISPQPTTGTLPSSQPSLSTDQKIFLTSGNIPVYAANNTSTLFQPTDKFFFKDAAGNMTEAVKIAQSPTQTVLSGQGIQPGATTIVRQSASKTDQVNIRMASLAMSSPNTNLRSGQTSSVTVTVDPKITDKDSAEAMQIPIMSLDVKNLAPNVVNMSGGNMQVMNFPTTPGSTSTAVWQTTRTITGVTPGNFNISATLYPSSSISNNMANTQMQALKTPDEFNQWINAVKQELEDEFSSTNDKAKKYLFRNTINALPLCSSEDDLDLCKMMADNLLRTSSIAIPGINLVANAPAFAAYQAATNNLVNASSTNPDFVHTDIIQHGLNYLQIQNLDQANPILKQQIKEAMQAIKEVNSDYSPQTISDLRTILNKINSSESVAALAKQLTNHDAPTQNMAGGKTRIGALDPFAGVLWVVPEYKDYVLNSFGATKQSNGTYQVHGKNNSNKLVAMNVNVIWTTPLLLNKKKDSTERLFDEYGRVKDDEKLKPGEYTYEWEYDLPPLYSGDEHPVYRVDSARIRRLDSLRRYGKTEFVNFFRDSIGPYNFYRNAQCVKVMSAHTEKACAANEKVENYSDSARYFEEYDKHFDRNPEKNKAGQFMKLELYDRYSCVGGDDFCIGRYNIVGLKYIYADKNCTKLVEVVQIIGLTCN